uniref:hypothetical protein n=1 Tax=Stappia sp. TaxID=1870903 RepID=UPI003BAB8C0F
MSFLVSSFVDETDVAQAILDGNLRFEKIVEEVAVHQGLESHTDAIISDIEHTAASDEAGRWLARLAQAMQET